MLLLGGSWSDFRLPGDVGAGDAMVMNGKVGENLDGGKSNDAKFLGGVGGHVFVVCGRCWMDSDADCWRGTYVF